MTELEIHQGNALALDDAQPFWNDHQIAALRQLGVDRATNGDLAVFHHVCQRTGLDPFARQIYMIERQGKQTIQTGIDGFRLVARRAVDRTGEKLSIGASEWADANGVWHDVWLSSTPPAAARVIVYRDGEPFPGTALWNEYAQTKRDGGYTAMWATRPAGQLAKCAEALALRKAFPNDLSGIYSDDEMAREERRQVIAKRGGLAAALAPETSGEAVSQGAPSATDSAVVRDGVFSPSPEPDPEPEDGSQMLTNRTSFGRMFYARMSERNFTDDQERIEYLSETVGRLVTSSKELTEDDARKVLARLDEEAGIEPAEVVA